MRCPCSANALRLFIRSVAQVDVLPGTRLTSISHQNLSVKHATIVSRSISRRQFSVAGNARQDASAAVREARGEEVEEVEESEDAVKGVTSTGGDGVKTSLLHGTAIAELSDEALDEIWAEAAEDIYPAPEVEAVENDDTPQRFVVNALEKQRAQKERKRREPQWQDDTETSPFRIDRRAREFASKPNDSSSEQYATFPRLPRIARDQTSAPSPPLKSRLQEPLKSKPKPLNWSPPPREQWQVEKAAIKAKYPSGYSPQKRLSPDAVTGIRALHAQMPEEYHTRKLAETFQVSPEAISRILRTKWTPNAEEEADRARRWLKRGEAVWTRYAEMGVKPPKRWREAGIGKDSEILKMAAEKRREGRKRKDVNKGGLPPVLVTLPKRPGGLYSIGGGKKRRSEDDGAGFI